MPYACRADRVGALDERDDLVRDAAVQRDVLLEQREHAPRERR